MHMREEFEKMAAAGKIERRHIEPLVQLATSGFCMHRSWGFGRIKTVDPVFARFTIDFPDKTGHTMDLAFAAESLKPIPRTTSSPARPRTSRARARWPPPTTSNSSSSSCNSYGGKATADQIQQVLVPDVIRGRLEEMVGRRPGAK